MLNRRLCKKNKENTQTNHFSLAIHCSQNVCYISLNGIFLGCFALANASF